MTDEIEAIKLETMKNEERLKRISAALDKEKKDAAEHEEKILSKIRKNEENKI
jgi:hypothetical protein